MAKSLLLSHKLEGDVRSDPEYSPHVYEDTVTDSQEQEQDEITANDSQQTVGTDAQPSAVFRKKYY